MKKTYDLKILAESHGGEYVLGTKDLNTHACYMIYGVLQPEEGDRIVEPGSGHEEILCAVNGPLVLNLASGPERLEPGHAIHVKDDEAFRISNPTDKPVVYFMAGGHSKPHHPAPEGGEARALK